MRVKAYLALLAELVVFGLVLFGAAGTVRWPQGWAFLAVFFGCSLWVTEAIYQRDPALLAERMRAPVQKDQPLWDRIFMPIVGLVFFAWLAAMGFDAGRLHLSHMPLWLEAIGALGVILGFWIVARVFFENTFLAPVVKIQEARGHKVISTGPYAVVRHPMYAGAALLIVCSALLLGSWIGVAASLALLIAIAIRAVFEERLLRTSLDGYNDYAARVRYR
ncbi:MAG TPA: isoprenylcysteine carboxylmethyltransferase family protein, partial [Rhizomicrobium sp.]|nr:isoprenylcysteine carboxylmethyltransferase family protein [Rhizomicrobium sp.]